MGYLRPRTPKVLTPLYHEHAFAAHVALTVLYVAIVSTSIEAIVMMADSNVLLLQCGSQCIVIT